MKKQTLPLLLITGLIILSLQSCLNDKGIVPGPPQTHCDSLDISYNIDVKPLVLTRCANSGACHVPGGGAIDLTAYEVISGVKQSVADRIQLSPLDPNHMPQFQPALPQEELEIFLCWIEKGAPNN